MAPLALGDIATITIREQGAISPASSAPDVDCSGFVLKHEEVEAYFASATQISEQDYRHMIDWSPCYVAGSLVLANGKVGNWGIQQLRGGSVSFNDGSTVYMYCPSCKAEAFIGDD